MRDLKASHETSIMFITHDLAVIASFSDRVMVMYAGVVVESASVRSIFKDPRHPYTLGLLGSIPVLGQVKRGRDGSRVMLNTIPGNLPDPKHFPVGCRFASRCSKVMPKCHEREPSLVELEDNHHVRCFLYSDAVREEEGQGERTPAESPQP